MAQNLVKIRISNHKLMMTLTDTIKLPTTIDSAVFVTLIDIIEDGFHFSCIFQSIQSQGKKFYNQIQQNFADFNQPSCTELKIKLKNSQNFSVNSHLLKFVSLCNDLRRIRYQIMCRCEGYGFQAVYSRIGYVNQSVWV